MEKKMTSAAVNKMIKKLNSEKEYLQTYENNARVYFEVDGKSPEPAEYNYAELNAKIDEIDRKVAKLRHAVNLFNTTTKLSDSELTLDEALVRMAQLNKKREKLDEMRRVIPKQRHFDRYGNSPLVEYACVNYDIDEVNADFDKVDDEISELQMKIDYLNQTRLFTVDI